MLDLNGRSVLITGGTGSLGIHLTKTILERWPNLRRLVIYSRDEQKQFQMAQEFPHAKYNAIRYFIGDIRDYDRLKTAMKDIEFVIHSAAMKHVPIAEYNPMECVKTNVLGAENVINACMETGVQRVVALSTDKAAAPINLYGATKLCSDKLFVAANNIRGKNPVRFSVVRYGNVMGSNGSVIPFFMKKRKEGVLPITDPNMTRLISPCRKVWTSFYTRWSMPGVVKFSFQKFHLIALLMLPKLLLLVANKKLWAFAREKKCMKK
jgi:FlaA1/EpsC-like NDP-sugar epimerase